MFSKDSYNKQAYYVTNREVFFGFYDITDGHMSTTVYRQNYMKNICVFREV